MKKEEKTELTRKRILCAAVREFGMHGYRGASINAICETGIPKGLLYHNYKNRDTLYLACVELCFKSLTECLRDADIGNDMEKYMRVRMEYFNRNEMETRIFFESVLQPPEELHEQIHEIRRNFDELNRKLYQEILNSVQLREDITYDDAMDYFSMLQYVFNSYFSCKSSEAASLSDKIYIHERVLPKILNIMLYGIARRER